VGITFAGQGVKLTDNEMHLHLEITIASPPPSKKGGKKKTTGFWNHARIAEHNFARLKVDIFIKEMCKSSLNRGQVIESSTQEGIQNNFIHF